MKLPFTRVAVTASPNRHCRGFVALSTCLSGVFLLGGCASATEATEQTRYRFNADANLLGPVTSTTYTISGDLDQPLPDVSGRTSHSHEDLEASTEATGTLVISDGMITSVELVVTLDSPNDLRFILTEPALFERRGEVLDSIPASGTLTADNAMYPDTQVTFTPEVTDKGTVVGASFAIPESLTAQSAHSSTTVQLQLMIQPLATFEEEGSHSAEREGR